MRRMVVEGSSCDWNCGVCTCRHSDAQVSIEFRMRVKRVEKNQPLGTGESPLYIVWRTHESLCGTRRGSVVTDSWES